MKFGVKCVCLQYALLNACYAVVIRYDDNAEHKSACIKRQKKSNSKCLPSLYSNSYANRLCDFVRTFDYFLSFLSPRVFVSLFSLLPVSLFVG
jgi:hypothetical protein